MRWPRVALGEVLARHDDWVPIEPESEYRQITARLWGQGLVLRAVVSGAEIAATSQNRVRTGQFLISKIDARHGAFGLVPEELDGAVVSNDFPAFAVDGTRCLPGFLRWVSKTDWFIALCKRASEGSTNRVRLRETAFLAQEIPLPPLSEQERIVRRLDAVEKILSDLARCRGERDAECTQSLRALIADQAGGATTPMRELVKLREPDVTVDRSATYEFAGVYSFGRGVFRAGTKSGMDFAYPRLTRLRAGDFTYPKLMAWEGALGIVPPECAGCVVSTEFPVFEVSQERVLPEVLDLYFRDPRVWPRLAGASTGTNARRRRLNPRDFLDYSFPLPSRDKQIKIAGAYHLVAKIRDRDRTIEAETRAILPALLAEAFGP
ncbi:restriction endonuclease subunit S [Crenalkalicoccus roseus]|uniref:restriction endonuclease subunit S n=1 Tax=Crenalkalicoccus roseus TaxID=1485588 RepID=UPI00107FF787|nr:restriction endonuclease subunit S [Crenalkalicoccus roseus]